MNLDWMDDAACATIGTEFFFPEQGGTHTFARRICAECPVRNQCLNYSFEIGAIDGVYGGLSPAQRRRMRVAAA